MFSFCFSTLGISGHAGGLPRGTAVKNPPAMWRLWFNPWVGKVPWRKEWLLTPVFLPGESHGQRSLAGCSSWAHTDLDLTE